MPKYSPKKFSTRLWIIFLECCLWFLHVMHKSQQENYLLISAILKPVMFYDRNLLAKTSTILVILELFIVVRIFDLGRQHPSAFRSNGRPCFRLSRWIMIFVNTAGVRVNFESRLGRVKFMQFDIYVGATGNLLDGHL